MSNLGRADEIRKQIQAAKDEIVRVVCSTSAYSEDLFAGVLHKLTDKLANLERQLIESDTVKVKKALIRDIPVGSMYYLQVKRCYEREFLANNFIYGYVPVE